MMTAMMVVAAAMVTAVVAATVTTAAIAAAPTTATAAVGKAAWGEPTAAAIRRLAVVAELVQAGALGMAAILRLAGALDTVEPQKLAAVREPVQEAALDIVRMTLMKLMTLTLIQMLQLRVPYQRASGGICIPAFSVGIPTCQLQRRDFMKEKI